MIDILDRLKALDDARADDIENWFAKQRAKAAPFLYSSVDLRHSGLRLVPVDTNLYPAGFNNLSPRGRARAARFLARLLEENHPKAKKVILIPENHTRNLGYLENLATLCDLFEGAGMDVRLGSLAAQAGEVIQVQSLSGRALTQYPLVRSGNQLTLEDGFTPDIIVMNNDMTAGAPAILESVSQAILPPVNMGWWRRRKTVHFAAYRELVNDFAAHLDLDPWLFAAEFHTCGQVDFKEREGLDCVAKGIDKVIATVQEKYKQYGISEEPYVYIKADSGTYGMGIMTVRSGAEVLDLNKKNRNKMQVIKEGARVSEVIIQEGIPTIDTVQGKPAEPMVYMVDGIPIGGMFRVNGERDALGNLNAAGMEFTGMCDEVENADCSELESVQDCHFRAYGIVAAIAALAAAREDYEKVLPLKACS